VCTIPQYNSNPQTFTFARYIAVATKGKIKVKSEEEGGGAGRGEGQGLADEAVRGVRNEDAGRRSISSSWASI
jgi:hypothetical protein